MGVSHYCNCLIVHNKYTSDLAVKVINNDDNERFCFCFIAMKQCLFQDIGTSITRIRTSN